MKRDPFENERKQWAFARKWEKVLPPPGHVDHVPPTRFGTDDYKRPLQMELTQSCVTAEPMSTYATPDVPVYDVGLIATLPPKSVASVTFASFPNLPVHLTKLPNWWHRLWARVFFGATYTRI